MPRSHRRQSYSSTSDDGSSSAELDDSVSRRRSRRSDSSSEDEHRGRSSSDSESSGKDSSSSDEGEPRRRSRGKRKRLTAMATEYSVGGTFLLFAAIAAYLWWSNLEPGAPISASPLPSQSTKASSVSPTGQTASAKSSSAGSPATNQTSSKTSSRVSSTAPASTTAPATPSSTGGGGPYKLIADYSGEKFFEGWEFWDKADPTHGQVKYLSRDDATKANLISASKDSIIMGRVDNTTTLPAGGFRDSVRIHSATPIKKGSLVVADIRRQPVGCGTWPAWWMHGADWPNGGELDILEGVSLQDVNHITVHSGSSDCKLDRTAEVTGTIAEEKTECNANLNGNEGCSYIEKAPNSYGKGFNDAGGGVFMTLFTKDEVSQWFWSRPDVPDSVKDAPDVSKLGPPSAKWPSSTCGSNFWAEEQTLIFDITLCGDWAGSQGVWDNGCSDVAPTCVEYVQQAASWTSAVFEVAYVRVYEV